MAKYREGALLTARDTDYRWEAKAFPFLNLEYGIDMNQDGSGFTGTPIRVHDGTDSTAWTGSNTVGTSATFNSTAQAFNGTKSIYFNRMDVADIVQLLDSGTTDLTSYEELTMHIYIDNNWNESDCIEMYGYNSGGAGEVGTRVSLEDYMNFLEYDTWQTVEIPLTAMGLETTTVDGFRIECITKSALGPRWYLDDFDIQEGTNIIEYTAQPDDSHIFEMFGIKMNIVHDGTKASGGYWNEFFGITKLSNGLVYQRYSNGLVAFNFTTTCFRDLPAVGFDETIEEEGTSGANTSTTRQFVLTFSHPIPMFGDDNDRVVIEVEDDLSSLLSYRSSIVGRQRLL